MANGAPGPQGRRVPPSLPVVVDTSEESMRWAEVRAGLRCAGCERRFAQGWEFIQLVPVKDPATLQRAVKRSTTVSCAYEDCEYAITCARDAVAVRPISKEWLFLDDPRMQAMFQQAQGADC